MPPTGHSVEIEHRLTKLEVFQAHTLEAMAKMEKRVALLQHCIQVLILSVVAIAHERIPWLVNLLIGLAKINPL